MAAIGCCSSSAAREASSGLQASLRIWPARTVRYISGGCTRAARVQPYHMSGRIAHVYRDTERDSNFEFQSQLAVLCSCQSAASTRTVRSFSGTVAGHSMISLPFALQSLFCSGLIESRVNGQKRSAIDRPGCGRGHLPICTV